MAHRQLGTRSRLTAAVVALIATGALAFAGPALAHTELVSSDPAEGATLTSAPSQVTLTFAEDLLPGTETVSINDANGNVVATSKVPAQGAVVTAPWPVGLADGAYVIAYRVVADDGHPVVGTVNVVLATGTTATASTVAPSAASTSASTAPATATDTETTNAAGGMSPVIVIIIGLAALAALVVVWALARRRRGDGA